MESPDELAGIWEAADGRGSVVGIALQLTTTFPASALSLKEAPQRWQSLTAMVYQRTGPEPRAEERNFIEDSRRGGQLRFERGQLTSHGNGVDLALHRGPGDTWTGRLHRQHFDENVVLRRPRMQAGTRADWFLGTWMDEFSPMRTCLHLGRASDGAFVGWSDHLQILGKVRYDRRVRRPEEMPEQFGVLAHVEAAGPGSLAVSMSRGAQSFGLPISFQATRQSDGGMHVVWENTGRAPSTWRPVAGASCLFP